MEALGESIENALILQLDPETLKIEGFELLDFKQQYVDGSPEWRRFLKGLRRLVTEGKAVPKPIAASIVAQLSDGIRELAIH